MIDYSKNQRSGLSWVVLVLPRLTRVAAASAGLGGLGDSPLHGRQLAGCLLGCLRSPLHGQLGVVHMVISEFHVQRERTSSDASGCGCKCPRQHDLAKSASGDGETVSVS